ncbi:hypothetical protein [Pseudonocardia sp.]|uniref:hypothetical protein n=1 Tax=Pseudonocardia sp. TaxID=60912 RepID=UPI003D0EAA33
MASWDDLVSYVRVRYEIMRQARDELWFNLPTTGERTQLVVVRQSDGDDGHPWVQIASPVAKLSDLDLPKLLELAGASVVGGVIALDGVAVLRDSIPLEDAGLAVFERSFRLIVETADELEKELTGTDVH